MNVLWQHPPTPAQARALAENDYDGFMPPGDAFAHQIEALPPNRLLPASTFYEIQVTAEGSLTARALLPLNHLTVLGIQGLAGFNAEYVLREGQPDIALVRGERAVGDAGSASVTFALARNVIFLTEHADGLAADLTRRELSPAQAAAEIASYRGGFVPVILGWRTRHLGPHSTLQTLLHTPVDTVTIETADPNGATS